MLLQLEMLQEVVIIITFQGHALVASEATIGCRCANPVLNLIEEGHHGTSWKDGSLARVL